MVIEVGVGTKGRLAYAKASASAAGLWPMARQGFGLAPERGFSLKARAGLLTMFAEGVNFAQASAIEEELQMVT